MPERNLTNGLRLIPHSHHEAATRRGYTTQQEAKLHLRGRIKVGRVGLEPTTDGL